jgi:hypothetical protein
MSAKAAWEFAAAIAALLAAAAWFAAAIAALLAAAAWFAAASHPVGIPGPSEYGGPSPGMIAHANKIMRGAALNRIAAALTGISSLAQFVAWAVSSA